MSRVVSAEGDTATEDFDIGADAVTPGKRIVGERDRRIDRIEVWIARQHELGMVLDHYAVARAQMAPLRPTHKPALSASHDVELACLGPESK